jgi:hypothetical protein
MLPAFVKYLDKQALHSPLITEEPNQELCTTVIIPTCNEPGIQDTLNSLLACRKTQHPVEVLILFNHSDSCNPEVALQNQTSFKQTSGWAQELNQSALKFFPILIENIPAKEAGVGFARKTLMDEAIRRFNQIGNSKGAIVSLDADSTVSENYLADIEIAFNAEKQPACTIFHYEHPYNLPGINNDIRQAIIKYELYLRYYRWALVSTGFPYPFYTIGSCFAVSTEAYVKQGGMNRRQAGEDFYFLNKIFLLANTIELPQITVYPSPRASDRVPFGTGAAVTKILDQNDWLVYHPQTFRLLKTLFCSVESLFKKSEAEIKSYYLQMPGEIQSFLSNDEFIQSIRQINQNAASTQSFLKKFFAWFDAFKIIKFLNFIHSGQIEKVPVGLAAMEWLSDLNVDLPSSAEETLLKIYRELDRKGNLGIFRK